MAAGLRFSGRQQYVHLKNVAMLETILWHQTESSFWPRKVSEPPPLFIGMALLHTGLPQWLSSKESACNAEAAGHQVQSFLCWEDPLEEGTVTHPSIPAW